MASTSSKVTASGSGSDASPKDATWLTIVGAEVLQELAGDRADRDARGGFARARALEHVAHVVVAVLDDAGQVGVARSRARDDGAVDARCFGARRRFDGHRPLPVLPVAVGNHQRDRTASRHAVADAAERLRAIRFDRHAAAAPVAALAAAELRGDRVEVDREAGGHAFENHHERLPVRLAGGQKSQHDAFILSEKFAHSGAPRAGSGANAVGVDLALWRMRVVTHAMNLMADRFLVCDEETAIDLASGNRVELVVSTSGGIRDQAKWATRCDQLARLHHRSIARLLDYGSLGEGQRFEAWRSDGRWRGSLRESERIRRRVEEWFRASGWTYDELGVDSLRHARGCAVVLPGADAGFEREQIGTNGGGREQSSLAPCVGLMEISRRSVAAVAEMFSDPADTRCRAVAILRTARIWPRNGRPGDRQGCSSPGICADGIARDSAGIERDSGRPIGGALHPIGFLSGLASAGAALAHLAKASRRDLRRPEKSERCVERGVGAGKRHGAHGRRSAHRGRCATQKSDHSGRQARERLAGPVRGSHVG